VFLESPGSDTNHADNNLRCDHANCSPNEKTSSTNLVNSPEGNRGANRVDKRSEDGDQERIVDRSKGGEEYISEVEDEVYASQLLHHLHHYPKNRSSKVTAAVGDGA
jgi:hypothetical protein